MLYVQLLGRPRLSLDGRPIDLTRRKSRAILYYLAAHARPLSRDRLLALFWPDLERAAAQQTLRVTLHGLRQTLGASLVADKDTLSLAGDSEVDVRVFEQRLSPPVADLKLLATTLELYRGDFLDGFILPDSPEFDDWAIAQTERYRRLAMRGQAALAEEYEKRGSFCNAIEALDLALGFEPLQEDLQRARLRVLYLAGDRTGAIRSYDTFRKLLKEEMGVPPMAETRALYDAILNDALPARQTPEPKHARSLKLGARTAVGAARTAEILPFTGRDALLEALRAAAEANRLVLIEGEPGIGKTRLVEEFISRSSSIPVVGVARELEHTIPYQPVIEALRGLISRADWPALEAGIGSGLLPIWRTEVARLVPEIAAPVAASQRGPRGADESRLWEGINQLLLAVARQHPVTVFLDDLHWAEAATLGALGYLIRQRTTAPLVFLAASRPVVPRSPLATLLQTLTREGRVVRLGLSRLDPGDIQAIASHLSPKYSYPLADWLIHASEGNPYILAELVRHARENGLLLPNGVVNLDMLSASPIVPQTVYSLVQSRLQRLSDGARRVLDAAVAIGREFEFDLVASATALSENAALDAVEELTVAGLIHPFDASRYRFDHPLTMEVACREVSEPHHRLLHRRVAEALESIHHNRLESIAGLLAWHFAEGNAPERAAPYAFKAGRQATELAAWTEAATFFEQALAAIDPGQRMSVLMALGQARLNAGQAVQASEAFREAISLAQASADASGVDAARLALVASFLYQARYSEVIALAQQVRETGLPESAMNAELHWGTALSLEGADLDEAARHLHLAEALCVEDAPGKLASLAQIKFELGGIAAQQGDLAQAIALYRETIEIAGRSEDQGDPVMYLVLAHNNLAYHLHLLNDPTAQEYALAGLRLAEEKGLVGLKPFLFSTLGEIALAGGDLKTAEEHLTEGLDIAQRLAVPERIAGLTANLGLLALKHGQDCLAIHRLSMALAQADGLGTRHLAAQIRLWLVPLLPTGEARAYLAEARNIAESGNRRRLLDEVARLEEQVSRE